MTKEDFKKYFSHQLELPTEYMTYIISYIYEETFKPIIFEKIDFEKQVESEDIDNLSYITTRANIPSFKYV